MELSTCSVLIASSSILVIFGLESFAFSRTCLTQFISLRFWYLYGYLFNRSYYDQVQNVLVNCQKVETGKSPSPTCPKKEKKISSGCVEPSKITILTPLVHDKWRLAELAEADKILLAVFRINIFAVYILLCNSSVRNKQKGQQIEASTFIFFYKMFSICRYQVPYKAAS